MRVALPQAELTEKQWQRQVVDLAAQCGWRRTYHTYDSRRSASGWPDLVLVRERVVFAELKREGGKLTAAQREWITALQRAGAETYVWVPSMLDEVAGVLTGRR
jgi:VRR-NUC domain